MKSAIIGYPRIGTNRELKFQTEAYFRKEKTAEELKQVGKDLRQKHWEKVRDAKVDYIPSNDFSFYDQVLDTAVLLNAIPNRYRALNLSPLDVTFAMARGYQQGDKDVHALPMKKWFNTNYHYLVPELSDPEEIKLVGTKPFDEYKEAKTLGIETKPVLIGPFTFLQLASYPEGLNKEAFLKPLIKAYQQLLHQFDTLGTEWIQIDEPALVYDLTEADQKLFTRLYEEILHHKQHVNVLLQTYFGDVRDVYQTLQSLPFDGIGLDVIEGVYNIELIKTYGFDQSKVLFLGLVNGKNIWRNNYQQSLEIINQIKPHAGEIVLSSSSSLLHVPYTVKSERHLSAEHVRHFSFAEEKLTELHELSQLVDVTDVAADEYFINNQQLFENARTEVDQHVRERVARLTDQDFERSPSLHERKKRQQERLKLPLLPTTTIGSFPQTADVKDNRRAFKAGEKTADAYHSFNKDKVKACIKWQEAIGLDVLVHGEYERNDMVEYFGEQLNGFIFTSHAWVQSYGTRCVKPPIVWGDVSRRAPMTVDYATYAQSLTKRPVKGMLTGPITILNWSFPREDLPVKETVAQIALAIREEVLDLEEAGIRIIQIDEAALREKLPLRQTDWHAKYLDWAIPLFRLTHAKVKPETQIHTHMCYSAFTDIIHDIDAMDADVITFESSRSNLELLQTLKAVDFKMAVGPGVYDIHSPRIPSVPELKATIEHILSVLPIENVWINPDCGLKTRKEAEVDQSLKHLVSATRAVKEAIVYENV